jgi:hypothetical protein
MNTNCLMALFPFNSSSSRSPSRALLTLSLTYFVLIKGLQLLSLVLNSRRWHSSQFQLSIHFLSAFTPLAQRTMTQVHLKWCKYEMCPSNLVIQIQLQNSLLHYPYTKLQIKVYGLRYLESFTADIWRKLEWSPPVTLKKIQRLQQCTFFRLRISHNE